MLADVDRLDLHPIALAPSAGVPIDRPIALPDVIRVLGAQVWLPRDPDDPRRPCDVPPADRVVVLEGGSSALGRRDAARALARALAGGRRPRGALRAWLDARHLGRPALTHVPGAASIERALGLDVSHAPVPVAPSVHATLGGLAVARAGAGDAARHGATTIPGLFAAGGAAVSPSGAARLGGHRLLTALFDGRGAAAAAAAWAEAEGTRAAEQASAVLAARAADEASSYDRVVERAGREGEVAEQVAREVGALLARGSEADGTSGDVDALDAELDDLADRAARARCSDRAAHVNRGAPAVRRLEGALLLARAVAATARARAAGDPARSLGVRVDDGAIVLERRRELDAVPPRSGRGDGEPS
jgi:succinate dehydrogenase/fumarate reductase flavoprotein subunit